MEVRMIPAAAAARRVGTTPRRRANNAIAAPPRTTCCQGSVSARARLMAGSDPTTDHENTRQTLQVLDAIESLSGDSVIDLADPSG